MAHARPVIQADDDSDSGSTDGGSSGSSVLGLGSLASQSQMSSRYEIADIADLADAGDLPDLPDDGEFTSLSDSPTKGSRRSKAKKHWVASLDTRMAGGDKNWQTYFTPNDMSPVMPKVIQPLLAEFIGTFILTFICVCFACNSSSSPDGGPISTGLTIAAVIIALGPVSGGHVNPAVSLGFALVGELRILKFILYSVCQTLGATAGALVARAIIPSSKYDAGLAGMVLIPASTDTIEAILTEAVITFFLVFIVLQTAADQPDAQLTPLAVGFVVTVNIYAVGEISGACMNPARAIGATMAATGSEVPHEGEDSMSTVQKSWLNNLWYLTGTFIGSILAAFVYRFATAKNPKYDLHSRVLGSRRRPPDSSAKPIDANGIQVIAPDPC